MFVTARDLIRALAVGAHRMAFALPLFFAPLTLHAQNLLANGDFSQTDSQGQPVGWTAEDASIVTTTTADHPAGYAQALQVTLPGNGGSDLGYVLQTLAVEATGAPVAPGQSYAARVWVKSSTSGQAELQVKRFSAGTEVDRITSVKSGTSWSQVTVAFDTNPGPSGEAIDHVQILL
ncbi:MAG: carbohydrate binding domain-containing protein, partial [Terriglobales bacterium]